MSEPVYCARCNVRIYGQTFICCEQLLHGQCYTRHRKESHVGHAGALRGTGDGETARAPYGSTA